MERLSSPIGQDAKHRRAPADGHRQKGAATIGRPQRPRTTSLRPDGSGTVAAAAGILHSIPVPQAMVEA
jgi:hypothetical protein